MWFVFEGLDGVGKSTVMGAVKQRLRAVGLRIHCLSTPCPAFNLVRESLESTNQLEMLLGFYIGCAGGTAQLVEHILRNDQADIVLVDRYIYSTLALAYSRRVTLTAVAQAFENAWLTPTAGFLVRCEESIRRTRLLKRGVDRELDQLDEQDVLARMVEAYETFNLCVLHNYNERLDDSAAEAVSVILKQHDSK